MNKDKNGLVYLLRAAINEADIEKDKLYNLNWKEVFKLAKDQQVYPIIYPIIRDLVLDTKENNDILIEWGKTSILSSVIQKQNINRIAIIINRLNKEGLELIVLKGLIIRDHYKLAEFRTISDYDILMKEEDLEKAHKVLLSMGYIEEHRD